MGSGMKSIEFAVHAIQMKPDSHIIICGGMESMSNVPYYIPSQDIRIHARPKSTGNKQIIDGMLHDGLWDCYSDQHMGNCGDICAETYKISRNEQDEHAITSFKRAQNATKCGIFKNERSKTGIQSEIWQRDCR